MEKTSQLNQFSYSEVAKDESLFGRSGKGARYGKAARNARDAKHAKDYAFPDHDCHYDFPSYRKASIQTNKSQVSLIEGVLQRKGTCNLLYTPL